MIPCRPGSGTGCVWAMAAMSGTGINGWRVRPFGGCQGCRPVASRSPAGTGRQPAGPTELQSWTCWSSLCVLPCRSCLYASACSTPRLSHSRAHAAASHARSHTSLWPPRAFLSALYSVPSQQLPRRGGSRSRTLAFYYQVLQFARSELMILLEAASRLVRSWKCWNLKNCVKFGSIQGCRTGLKERQERFWGRNNRLLLCGSWWDSWLY